MKYALIRFVFKEFTLTYYLPLSAQEDPEFLENFSKYILGLRAPVSLTIVLKDKDSYTSYFAFFNTHVITKRSSKSPSPLSLKLCEHAKDTDFPFGSLLSLFAGGISFYHPEETITFYAQYLDDFTKKENISFAFNEKYKKTKHFRPYFKMKPNEKFKRKLEILYKMAA